MPATDDPDEPTKVGGVPADESADSDERTAGSGEADAHAGGHRADRGGRRLAVAAVALAVIGSIGVASGIYLSKNKHEDEPRAAASPSASSEPAFGTVTKVTVERKRCAPDWHGAPGGRSTLRVTNTSGLGAQVTVIDPKERVVATLNTIGSGTSANVPMWLTPGYKYRVRCLLSTVSDPLDSAAHESTTGARGYEPLAAKEATEAELQPAADGYQSYVGTQIGTLKRQVETLTSDLKHGNLDQAKKDWLPAQLTWKSLGAAYGSFGTLGDQIDGTAAGKPQGVNDPNWRGLHRIEYGLWHGQSAAALMPVATQLGLDLHTLELALPTNSTGNADDVPTIAVGPGDMPVRGHEILEDTQRDSMSGHDDYGSGTTLKQMSVDVSTTRKVLDLLKTPIAKRDAGFAARADRKLTRLDKAITAAGSTPVTKLDRAKRQELDAALGDALETLAEVPQLLEIANGHDPAQPDIS